MKKGVIITVLLVAIVGAFAWFQVRPSIIRSSCQKKVDAENKKWSEMRNRARLTFERTGNDAEDLAEITRIGKAKREYGKGFPKERGESVTESLHKHGERKYRNCVRRWGLSN